MLFRYAQKGDFTTKSTKESLNTQSFILI